MGNSDRIGIIVTSTPAQRKEWLAEIEGIVWRFFPRD